MPASACGLPPISKVSTAIGLAGQLYRNAKVPNLNFVVQKSKKFSISSCFEPIDVVILCTLWWPQLHSTYHWPQVSSIYFMRFLWLQACNCQSNPFYRALCAFMVSSSTFLWFYLKNKECMWGYMLATCNVLWYR